MMENNLKLHYFSLVITLSACFTNNNFPAKSFKATSGKIAASQVSFRDFYCHFRSQTKAKGNCKTEALTVDSKFFKDNLSSIEEQKKRLLEYKPESFYNRSLKEEPNKIKSSPFKNPEAITIILSTGLFSELTSVVPFYKVLSKDYESSFRRKLDKALSKKKLSAKVFSLKEIKMVDRPLKELLAYGSIDDENNNPIVNIIYLKPELGSFETFGYFDKNKKLYDERLSKLFSAVAPPKRIYLAGHSRGASLMLDYLSYISKNKRILSFTRTSKDLYPLMVLYGEAPTLILW